MKRKIISLILLLSLLVSCAAGGGGETATTDEEKKEPEMKYNDASIEKSKTFLDGLIENDLFVSFEIGDESFPKDADKWQKTVENGENTYKITYLSTDGVKLTVDVDYDGEYSSIYWVCNFENGGDGNSRVIKDVKPLSFTYTLEGVTLRTSNGSSNRADDFEIIDNDLKNRASYSSEGGRSSSGGFPYFDLSNEKEGVIIALGWTGNWSASFEKKENTVSVSGGMQRTQISLKKGESMITPSVMVTFFEGDRDDGHNKLRSLILKSYTPTDKNGEKITSLPFCVSTWGGLGEEELMKQIELLDGVNIGQNVLWIDAGWYCDGKSTSSGQLVWDKEVGKLDISKTLYPDGFKNVSKKLSEMSTDLLLWFEPERCAAGTGLSAEHPEYYYSKNVGSRLLLKLSDDGVCEFMTDKLAGIIKENGISVYRQDFNIAPAAFWSENDAEEGENRVGITEIKYITNLYKMLDGLLEKCPGLLIDNCASGGRRLDIEMMKRSVPLWRTDYTPVTSTTDEIRSIVYSLSYWLPLSEGGCSGQGRKSSYDWRSMTAAGLDLGFASVKNGLDYKNLEEFLSLTEYVKGDYYMLEHQTLENMSKKISAYEYYLSDEGKGVVLAFRPEECLTGKTTVKLKGLESTKTYTLDFPDSGETLTASGKALMELGVSIRFDSSRSSVLIKFQ